MNRIETVCASVFGDPCDCKKSVPDIIEAAQKLSSQMNTKNYAQHGSHYHCWNNPEESKHLTCCLCGLENPSTKSKDTWLGPDATYATPPQEEKCEHLGGGPGVGNIRWCGDCGKRFDDSPTPSETRGEFPRDEKTGMTGFVGMGAPLYKPEDWEKDFDRLFHNPSVLVRVNAEYPTELIKKLHEEADWKYRDKVKMYIRALLSSQRTKDLEALVREIEGMKLKKDYDGNDLQSACQEYGIAAEGWPEIIRFEDGYSSALQSIIELIKARK